MFTFKTRVKEGLKIQTGKNSRVFFKFSVLDNNLNLPTSFAAVTSSSKQSMFSVLKYFWERHQHPPDLVL